MSSAVQTERGHYSENNPQTTSSDTAELRGSPGERTPLLRNRNSRGFAASGSGYQHPDCYVNGMDCTGCLFSITLLLAVLACMGLILLSVYVPESVNNPEYDMLLGFYSWYFFWYNVCFVVILFWCFNKLRSDCYPLSRQPVIHASDVILIFCTFGLMFHVAMELIAAVSLVADPGLGLYARLETAECIINIFAVWFQTTFIITASKFVRLQPSAIGTWGIQYLCLFLMMCNLGYWGLNSFIEIQFPQISTVQHHYYIDGQWNDIDHVTMPLAIYYRFHSFLSFLKLSLAFSFYQPMTRHSSNTDVV